MSLELFDFVWVSDPNHDEGAGMLSDVFADQVLVAMCDGGENQNFLQVHRDNIKVIVPAPKSH